MSALPRRNPYTQLPIPYTGYVPIKDYASGQVKPQVEELIDRYRPAVLWCDIGGRETYFHSNAWIDDYYRTVPDGVVNVVCGPGPLHVGQHFLFFLPLCLFPTWPHDEFHFAPIVRSECPACRMFLAALLPAF